MHSTKSEILALLKRSDGASVDEISSSVGLASMTVRQHLIALERDDLVRAAEVRRATGRPHFRYSLTENGHRSISQGYDRLVALLVGAMPSNGDAEGAGSSRAVRRELFRRAARALAAQHRAAIDITDGKQRVELVVAILRAHGGFAEYHELDGAFELRDFSCVFRSLLGSLGPCEWHEPFLRAVFGEDIEPAPEPGDGCAACCRYLLPLRATAAAKG